MNSIDEDVRRKFESAWISNQAAISIREFLPNLSAEAYLGTLEELVSIDLEFRWRHNQGQQSNSDQTVSAENTLMPTRVEDYLREFPELDSPDTVARLVEQEIVARRNSGFVVEQSEYLSRFPRVSIDASLFEQEFTRPLSSASSTSMSFPQPFGSYILTARLGQGGMGAVYRARQPSAGREVAIKIADVGSANSYNQNVIATRFETEAHAAASLNHDNVVPIFDVGNIDGQPYYAMRLIEGGDLSSMSKQDPLEPKQAARYMLGIAHGVAAAHALGLLHRDIKPQNIMVDAATGRAMLTDFGLARWAVDDSGLTHAGQVLGTPSYMPPEQISDSSKIDERADVYSLGGTLYQLLTGKPPFKAADVHETLRQVIHEEPVPAARLNPAVPGELDTICLKCLEKDPAARYLTAQAFAEELERFLDGRPILAKPANSITRLRKWCVRNRSLATALAGLLVVSAVAFVGLIIFVAILTSLNSTLNTRNQQLTISNANTSVALTTARSSLDNFYTQFSDEPILKMPGVAPLRQRFLQQSFELYDKLAAVEGDTSETKLEQAFARSAAGNLIIELNQSPDEAEALLKQAVASAEQLHTLSSSELSFRVRSNAFNGLGKIARRRNELEQALTYFGQAEAVRRAWLEATEESTEASTEVTRKLANAMMNQGLILAALDRLIESEVKQADAQQLRRQLMDAGAGNDQVLRDFAMGLHNLAMLEFKQGQPEEIVRRLHAASTEFRNLAGRTPNDFGLWKLLSSSLIYEGNFIVQYESPDDYADGVACVAEALKNLDSMVDLSLSQPAVCIEMLDLYQIGIQTLLSVQGLEDARPEWMAPSAGDSIDNVSQLIGELKSRLSADPSLKLTAKAQGDFLAIEAVSLRHRAEFLFSNSQPFDALRAIEDAVAFCEANLTHLGQQPESISTAELLRGEIAVLAELKNYVLQE